MTEIVMPSGSRFGGPPELIRRFLYQGGRVVNPVPREPRVIVTERKVRVLAVVHGWFPYLAAGSERMVQHMLDALPRDEFEVEVLSFGIGDLRGKQTPYDYEGTRVHTGFKAPMEPDIIITHHGPGARVCRSLLDEFPNAAMVAVFHNERYDIPDILNLDADLNVFNTEWVKDTIRRPGVVVHPPLEYDRHHVPEIGSAVTLVNLQENKGVRLFNQLAREMPYTPFLGVIGTHGEQEPEYNLPNLDISPVVQDMRPIWALSKVVLMPSGYESYGMVAAEAQASGIPVIAHPTPGLQECLGSAGIFVHRDDIEGYKRVLNLLLTDQNHYDERRALAHLRGTELVDQTKKELSVFVTQMRKLVTR